MSLVVRIAARLFPVAFAMAPLVGAVAQPAFTPGAGTEGRHWLKEPPTDCVRPPGARRIFAAAAERGTGSARPLI